jgi:hypothetical protein
MSEIDFFSIVVSFDNFVLSPAAGKWSAVYKNCRGMNRRRGSSLARFERPCSSSALSPISIGIFTILSNSKFHVEVLYDSVSSKDIRQRRLDSG